MAALSAAAGVAACVALVLAVLSWQRRDRRGARPFAAMMGANAVWLAAFAAELAATDVAGALPWFQIRMAVLLFVPATWLLFAVDYSEYGEGSTRRFAAATYAVPAVTAALTLANGSGGVLWSAPEMVTRGSFRLLVVDYAAGWWASVAYSYLLIAAGVVLIAGVAAASTGLYRKQSLLVLSGALPPAAANAVYYAGVSPVPELDLTPFAFIVEGVVVFWALFGYGLFDRSPVARSAVVDTMDDPMVAVDGEGYVVDVNPAAERLSPRAAPLGGRFGDAFPSIAAAVDVDSAHDDEAVAVAVDGDRRSFDSRVTPLSGNKGAVVVLRDVTRRRERERSLAAIQDASRDLMGASTPEAVCERTVEAVREVLDLEYVGIHAYEDGRLVPVATTDELRDLYDPVPSYAVGEGLQGTVYERGERLVVENVHDADCALKDESTPVRGVALFPLGEYGVLGAGSEEPFSRDDTAVQLTAVLAANATAALTRAERECDLARQNERLDEFADIVSHDLRNPLSVAQGYLDVARETDDETALAEVDEALDRMEVLVDDLLELARSGRDVTDPEPVRLADVARDAWDGIDSADAAFEVTAQDAVVAADRSRLRQLFENLFRNAVEHGSTGPASQTRQDSVEHGSTSNRNASRSDDAVEHGSTGPASQARQDSVEHGSPGDSPADGDSGAPLYRSAESADGGPAQRPPVTVRVGTLERVGSDREAGATGFYVADDGLGIPPENQEAVFERSYTTDDDGTGLGLAIVRDVAEAHGWSVAATESTDGGARFEVTGVEFR
ncbi:histidine kinase N-terminal 7TM domain-containing protein [Halostella salina]|uniref:histidine kinase N-terminal 7TM domain-containing protein n=1 Tax=Halostella salina TaxID=1547897 RepID=UPI000EF78B25|nr:histidine kinase N-terminal 7TM domain-containing protein [Halostella salina]